MLPLSSDLRERIVKRYQQGDVTYAAVAEIFGVGEASVSRFLRRWRERGDVERKPPGGGYPPRIADEDLPRLVKLVAEKPDRTVKELSEVWNARYGGTTTRSSVQRALARAGLSRKKSRSAPPSKHGPTSRTSARPSSKKSQG